MRAAVVVWGAVAAAAFAVSLPAAFRARRTVCDDATCAPGALDAAAAARLDATGISTEVWAMTGIAMATVFALTCFAAGALLLRRAGDVAVATAAVLFALAVAFPQTLDALAAAVPALGPAVTIVTSLSLAALVAWMLTFPDGRLRSRASAVTLIVALAYCILVPIAALIGIAFPVVALVGLVVLAAIAVDVVVRFASPSGRAQRSQTGLVLLAAAAAIVALGVAGILQATVVPSGSLVDIALQALLMLLFLLLPVSIALSVLRRGLWDGNGSLLRTLAASVTAAVILAAFAIVFATSAAAGADPSVVAVIAAASASVVAVPLFAAIRDGIRRLTRTPADPAHAVRDLSARLAPTGDPETMADAAAAATVDAFGFRAAWLERDGEAPPAVSVAEPGTVRIPITHGEQVFGSLAVVPRPLQDLSDRRNHAALAGIAAYIGAALAEAARARDLRAAHAELVVAREDERRMLRDELHDDLGPLLGSVVLRLRAAENSLGPDEPTQELIRGSRRDVSDAVAVMRRVAYRLRPLALDEQGLEAALESVAHAFSVGGFEVVVHDGTAGAEIPSAVQLVAYRIAVEAIANAARHSRGTTCRVRIDAADSGLRVTIEDDGRGGAVEPGVGVLSMHERARSVGGSVEIVADGSGGMRVVAALPFALAGERT